MKKKCKNCGAVQDGARNTCIDCGAILPPPMSREEEKELNEAIDDKLSGMSERSEDFYVPLWAKIVAALSALCLVGGVLFCTFSKNAKYADATWIALLFPTSVLSVISLAFPKLEWILSTFRRRWWFSGGYELQPSETYLFVQKLVGVVCFAVAVISLLALVAGFEL